MRQDQARVTLRVRRADGSWRDCGVFSKREGGETTAEDNKHFPGGMLPQVSLGSPATVANVTLTKLRRATDVELQRWLRTRVGKGGVDDPNAEAVEQPLDGDGNAFGVPEVYRGTLMRVSPPDHDANATAASELVVEISTAGSVG